MFQNICFKSTDFSAYAARIPSRICYTRADSSVSRSHLISRTMMEFTCGALQARGTTGDFVGLRCGEIMGPLFKVVSVQHMEYVPQPIGSEPHDEVTLMEGPN